MNYREWTRGKPSGPFWEALRLAASIAERPVMMAVQARNLLYDHGLLPITKTRAPVISVGNITMGGTGKTPFVSWVARKVMDQGMDVTILSRGYGAREGLNDEARELAIRVPGASHIQHPDRVAAARQASSSVLLLDDGFQHRRLARSLDIILLDALDPFGGGFLLPRGMLREPVQGLGRANAIVLTRSDAVSDGRRSEIRSVVSRIAPHACWAEACFHPQVLVSSSGQREHLSTLRGKKVAAFCGIGNPDGFRHTLSSCGAQEVGLLAFPDHCHYSQASIKKLGDWIAATKPDIVICTMKDLVKIPLNELHDVPLFGLMIDMAIDRGEEGVMDLVTAALQKRPD